MKKMLIENMIRGGFTPRNEAQRRAIQQLMTEQTDPQLKKVLEPYFLSALNNDKTGAIATATAIYWTEDVKKGATSAYVYTMKAIPVTFTDKVDSTVKSIPMIMFTGGGEFGKIDVITKLTFPPEALKFQSIDKQWLDISGGVGGAGWSTEKGAAGVAAVVSSLTSANIPMDVYAKHLELNKATFTNQIATIKASEYWPKLKTALSSGANSSNAGKAIAAFVG